MQTRLRVAAYVIRHNPGPELLVFDHVGMPEAGTQIPAGGVRPGEGSEQAVLREVLEETGLRTTLLNPIAVDTKPHPTTNQPRRTTYFHLQAPATTPNAWTHKVNGTGTDTGLTFACHFLPLPLEQPLADTQDAWLAHINPQWATPNAQATSNAEPQAHD
ncbi:NUDIX domain-containing protein [Spirillospora sp. NPDC052242]